ncbi:uncharacterized protein METZ01_LOCUS32867 [marine metagenome]|uniref:FlgD Ig-like domain-containing protein n=1 Tax=marine metagenome TaxID=408172 RepID=A0A381QR27_9ZZZZ
MKKQLLLILSLFVLQTGLADESYNTNGDFTLDYSLNGHGDPNFAELLDSAGLGAQSVLAGMDFDGDGLGEILFSIDETLAPGGPDPGKLGCYLYEADGSGGYNHVWHFVTPDPGNSLPGMFHGDIDGDGLHEIYFGVPPAVGANDNTWGTYIFEQNADGTFPTTATLLFQYGMTSADNFRPAGYDIGDVDGDGNLELCTVDRGTRKLSIDQLSTTGLDGFAGFTNEFVDSLHLGGGSVYNLDIVDFDGDGHQEVWVNTWDNFSMAVFESDAQGGMALAADLNGIFPDGDPASFRRNGFAFHDADGDMDLDAWFPMTNGKLYYLENSVNDLDELVAGENQMTNGGLESGTTGWGFWPDPMVNMAMIGTGETMFNTDSTFTAFEGDSALKIWGLYAGGTNMENNAFILYTGNNAIAPGSQFVTSAEFYTNSADDLNQLDAYGVLYAKYFGDNYSWIGMETVNFQSSAPDLWHHREVLCTVPDGATIIQVGVMHVQPSDTSHGSFYVDDLQLRMVDSIGVDLLAAGHFSEVLTFGERNRGSDMGDIDGDGKMDIIAGTGTKETIVRMEFMGGDPTDESRYDVTTIFESKGEPADRYYPLDISDSDLDGDGNLEVVLTNLYASNADQPLIFVLDNNEFSWDWDGGNEAWHLADNWSIAAIGLKTAGDSLFQTDPTGNSRTAIGGMDMDGDGAAEVIVTDYPGHRVIVFEYDGANNAFDVVWTSPVVEAVNHSANPRTVGVGDLDGDGKQEIVFPSSNVDAEGYHIYEWDGVMGSDNYGTTFSSNCQVEVDTCCAEDGPGTDTYGASFRGDHERITLFDVDGDGRQELVTAVRRGGPRGTLIVSLNDGDDIVHNSGGGFETWNTEFFVDRGDYGGGSPYQALPADLNGDGNFELVNHTWNYFNFYNITSTGENEYAIADVGAEGSFYQTTYPNDEVSLFGGTAGDIDGDGNDEAYFASYGSWGVGTNDVYVIDYDAGDDVLTINEDHVTKIGNVGTFHAAIGRGGYDGGGKTVFFGRGRPNVSGLEYIGPDPSHAGSYMERPVYWGELDVTQNTTTTDETGAVTVSHSQKWGFVSKIVTEWDGASLDFDMDSKKELLVSFQNVTDTLTHTAYTWNATTSQYDTVLTKVANPKPWNFLVLENGTDQLDADEPMMFINPEEYRLAQNYPNPFNPNTTIEYTVPINRKVSIHVYNITGQLVKTLVDNQLVTSGTHKVVWNGKNNLDRKVSTGMYLYSLEWAGMKKVKSMTLLK